MKPLILIAYMALAGCGLAQQRADEAAQAACSHLQPGTQAYGECYGAAYSNDLNSRRAASAAISGAILSKPAPVYTKPLTCYTTGNTTTCY